MPTGTAAWEESFSAVYVVLRKLAAAQLRRGAPGTLHTTALVHEAWMRLAKRDRFESRGHFLAVAATAMRQILVDHARRRRAEKRGGGAVFLTSSFGDVPVAANADRVVGVHAALEKLEAVDPRLARVIEWRFFGGLEEVEIAAAMGVDVRTVRRAFRKARAFVLAELGDPP
ncbi:MAG TPA: ECF-type sigma factor [Myxococcaceae bacterium]|nr:ECF-type sigma factor [Myxococcaceae bacterium]